MKLQENVRWLVFVPLIILTGCYYDHEAILYPSKANCNAEASATFSVDVLPLLNTRCNSCHSGAFPSGGISLDTYERVSVYVENGKLMGSINQLPGYSPMPQNTGKMSPCEIGKIQTWITSGILNN